MEATQEATTSAIGTANNNINSSSSSSSSSSNTDAINMRAAGGEGGGGDGSTNGRIGTPAPEMVTGGGSPKSVSALCRICMFDGGRPEQEDGGRLPLESLFRTTVESKTLYSMLVSVCSPLAHANNDGMPDKICVGCKPKLVQAFKLYEMCIKSDERIRKLLQTQAQFGGVQVKLEVPDDDDDVVELPNMDLYYDAHQIKREDPYGHDDYFFDGQFYGAALAQTIHHTPNLRIQSVRNGPEVLVQLQEHSFPTIEMPPKPVFQCEKYVKVTPKGHHCTLCGKDFKYFSYFKQHALAQHDPEKPFKCEQCKYTFKTEQRLFIHMRTHMEPEVPPSPVVVTGRPPASASILPDADAEMLETEPDLGDHDMTDDLDEDEKKDLDISINPDTGEKVYQCRICQKKLTTLPLYQRHRTVHTVRGRPFECEICHYRFAMKFSYNAHMLRHEQGLDPAQPASYKCSECEESFPKRKLLNIHMVAEHDQSMEEREPLNKTAPAAILATSIIDGRHGHACPICSETFNRESVLNNHMKTHELEAAQLKHSEICYACTVCGVECESREIFNIHIKTHPDFQPQYDQQQNADVTAVDLSDDEQQTSQNGSETDPLSIAPTPSKSDGGAGGKPAVRCDLCDKTFPYACNLKQHKIIHHSELKPHECKVCHYRFEYEGTLMRHMQKHSKSEQNAAAAATNSDDVDAPPGASLVYKCKLCSARFQKQKSMTWHLKTHRSIVAANEGTSVQEIEQSLHSPPTPIKVGGGPQAASSPLPSSAADAFAAKLDLKPQQAAGKGGSSKMYKCSYCPQNLDSEDAYYQHMKGHRVRSNNSDPLQDDSESPPKKKRAWVRSGDHHRCHLCHKVFTFRSQLQQHTALHHQPGKPYECGKCHYSFVHKLNLKRHELTHLEEERLANEEEEDPIKLLEDENFNANLDEMVEPVLEEGNNQDESDTPGETTGPKKRNKCVVCSALFQREDQLIEHLKTHIERIKVNKQETQSAKKIFGGEDSDRKCKLCHKVFKFSCQLKQHIQMHHSKDKPFECNICKYRFEFKGHMIRHKANNHADEVAAEEAESDELPSKITTPVVNPDGSEVYQCPVCPMNFVKQRSLTWHLKTHTGRRPKMEPNSDGGYPSTSSGEIMQCRFCSRTFRDVYELKAHMVTHIGSGGGHNASTVDSEHSLFGSGLEMMLQDFPDTMENHGGDPLFDASNLELVLEDGFGNDDLDFNVRYHHDTPPLPPAKRSLPANESLSSVYDVAEPGASTTPAKGKIICELCKKDFLYACNLKQHMQLHHAKEKPFECKICFYRFEYSGHLVRHVRQNHDGEGGADESVTKSFVCTFCSELFESKSQLNGHIYTYHRGEKQFKCEFCPASFSYKKSYDTHREEHHSNKRSADSDSTVAPSTSTGNATPSSFSCNFCKKKFSSAQKVDNHVCFQ